jgi:segregation and condensation protein B
MTGGRMSEDAAELARSYGEVLGQQPHVESDNESAPPPLKRILEAILFTGGAPLSGVRATEAVRGLTATQLAEIVDELNRDYRSQGRPYRIQLRDKGYEMTLQPRFRAVVDRLYGSTREARLSPQALDVLSLVAYRQPVTKQEIESLRGAESGGQLRQLVRLGLIALQRGEASQKEVTYSTTAKFLKLFGLSTLDDLPRTQDLQQI